jgi:hypothetical protein
VVDMGDDGEVADAGCGRFGHGRFIRGLGGERNGEVGGGGFVSFGDVLLDRSGGWTFVSRDTIGRGADLLRLLAFCIKIG